MSRVGVAISGGGHRASLWGAGVLLYLADAGVNRQVRSIASVSGGSITNGVLAQSGDFTEMAPGDVRAGLKPLMRLIAFDGLFAFGPSTNRYVRTVLALAGISGVLAVAALLQALLMAVEAATGWVPFPQPLEVAALGWTLVAMLAFGMLAAALFTRRSQVVERALARTLLSTDGRPTALADLPRRAGHVFCATELQSANHLYFSPDLVYGYRFGLGVPGPTTLAAAVQASACLPGAFAPRSWPTAPHQFVRLHVDEPAEEPARMLLSDGGVYDNMADQWQQGLDARLRAYPQLREHHEQVGELVVANASAGWTWQPARRFGRLALEAAGILRAKDVMYNATTAHRRLDLVMRFERAAESGEDLNGVVVGIAQTPFAMADRYAGSTQWPDRAARAEAVLAALGDTRQEWERQAARSAGTHTTLGRVGEEATVDLLRHAYVLAMCNLHVVLGHPLLDVPDRACFRSLLRPAAAPEPSAADRPLAARGR